ncbi:MAG: hypothetical protein AUH85_07840 [Chloroflexi bacterium 13_1_40CM_4_68_4]|nr:MAG: hypothetical protein AUH85_07840 [Chloroflexi bacterium 13_1_40CM_4_68_4]
MSRSSLLVLAVTRALVEAVPLAVGAAIVAVGFRRDAPLLPLWLDSAAAMVCWATIAPRVAPRVRVAAALSFAAAAAAIVVVLGGGIANPAWVVAGLASALYAGLLMWRAVAVAATATSWRTAAYANGATVVALAIAAIAFPVKRDVAMMAIAAGVAGTIALSTARAVEETFASRKGSQARTAPGWLSSLAVAIGAVLVAGAFPALGRVLGAMAEGTGPFVQAVLVIIVTPFVYLTEWLVRAILPLLLRIRIALPFVNLAPIDPQAEEEYARQFSLGAQVFLQRFAIVIVVLVTAALIARAVIARVVVTRASAPLERERIDGASITELVRAMFGAPDVGRATRPQGADPASRVRRAYWDLLAVSERAGPGWREPAQTPREHRAALEGAAWGRADAVVTAFERVRYGPGVVETDADEAEHALHELIAAVSARV